MEVVGVTRLGEGRLRCGTGGAGTCADRTRCIPVLVVLTIAVAFLLSGPLFALTPAGTSVSNIATGSYSDGSVPSNAVAFTVSPMADLDILAAVSTATGAPGTLICYPVTVQNAGNGSDSVNLAASSARGWPCTVYADSNGDGVHQSAETTVVTTATVPAGGTIACFAAVTIPAAAVGADTETVTATSGVNASVSASASLTTTPTTPTVLPPTADFGADVTGGKVPLTVKFTDQSTGSPTSWSWSFGDGSTSSQQNPTHQYQTPGAYTVSLTASNSGGPNTKTRSAFITVTAAPVASFYGTPTSGDAPLTVGFVDQSNSSPTAWLWEFGDGGTSNAQNPTHTYANPGAYSVSLTTTTGAGTASKTFTNYIQVTQPVPSVEADFSAAPTTGTAPLTVAFSDKTVGDPTSWTWNFGDGTTSAEQYPSHVYTSPGSYSVALTVSCSGGGTDSITRAKCVTVSEPSSVPVPNFSGKPASGRVPLTVVFTDQTSGLDSTSTWDWNFGDGTHGSDRNPVHAYGKQGTFSVTLTVTNSAGSASRRRFNYIQARRSSNGWSGLFWRVPAPRDVDEGFWAYNEIVSLGEAGIAFGYPDGMFHSDMTVNRDQVAVFLARAVAGGDAEVPDGPSAPSFNDVPADNWAYKYVEYAKGKGIVAGYEGAMYRPTETVNRGQMAVLLARTMVDPIGDAGLESYTPPSAPTFRDVTPTNKFSWAYRHVEYLVSEGMVAGYPDGLYRPASSVPRDQMSVYIARVFGLVD